MTGVFIGGYSGKIPTPDTQRPIAAKNMFSRSECVIRPVIYRGPPLSSERSVSSGDPHPSGTQRNSIAESLQSMAMKAKRIVDGGGIVYSTEHGKMCPRCGKPASECFCDRGGSGAPGGDGIVRVGRETKGRKGKGVTVVTGVPVPLAELETIGTQLKKRCGSGGTVKDGVIEIQGDHRDLVVEELKKLGFTVKRAGG